MQTKLLQAFLAAGAPENQAQAAAESVADVIATPPGEMATKADITNLEMSTKAYIAVLRTEIAEVEARLTWRIIAIVGVAVAILKLT